MKFLVVEDEFTTRLILQKILGEHGEVHIAANGREAVQAVKQACQCGELYNLITLDVIMPEMDGQAALKEIRDLESGYSIPHAKRARIIMTTAMNDGKNIMAAFKEQCDGYLIKPINRSKLENFIAEIEII